jgi:hypothetical protein
MKKYMLISTVEREFMPPQFFDTPEAAHAMMEKELLGRIGSYDDHTEEYDYGISGDSAWSNVHVHSDWAIYMLTVEVVVGYSAVQ